MPARASVPGQRHQSSPGLIVDGGAQGLPAASVRACELRAGLAAFRSVPATASPAQGRPAHPHGHCLRGGHRAHPRPPLHLLRPQSRVRDLLLGERVCS